MHNLISFNQLAFWHTNELTENQDELVNEYFECLTECDDDQQTCRRICRSILSS